MAFILKRELDLYMNPPNEEFQMKEHLGEKWKLYKHGWIVSEHAKGFREKTSRERVDNFLSAIGDDCVELYNNFTWEKEEDKYDIDKVVQKFDDHFDKWVEDHKESQDAARERFLSRVQEPDEDLMTFATDLRRLSIYCGWGLQREEQILQQTIKGMSDPALKKRMKEDKKRFRTVIYRLENRSHVTVPTKEDNSQSIPNKIRRDLSSLLNMFVEHGTIAPVKKTLPLWAISDLIITTDLYGNGLRICLHGADVEWLQPETEDSEIRIALRSFQLRRYMYFSIVNIKCGLWDDSDETLLTNFNTPFGMFRWVHIPLGLKQNFDDRMRRVKYMIRKLECLKIVDNDLVVYGFGDNDAEAISNHDKNFEKMVETIEKYRLTLNHKCVRKCQKELRYKKMSIKGGTRLNCPDVDDYPCCAPIYDMIIKS